MENVTQWWNIVKYLSPNSTTSANELRAHYIQCCRELSDAVELPNQLFGSGSMCAHCGSLWDTIDEKVRLSRGKNPSRAIQKLIRAGNNHGNLSNYQQKLVDKCVENQSNKLLITCSCCKKITKIFLNKPKKIKNQRIKKIKDIAQKKKKKNKDKTAGLLIDMPKTPCKKLVDNQSTPPPSANINEWLKNINLAPSTGKQKKINTTKLKGMISSTDNSVRAPVLDGFLSEINK